MSNNRASETPPSAVRNGPRPRSLRAAWVALSGLSAVFLFEMLDNSVLNVALPTIGRELGASTTALQWVTSSYAVVFGGLMIALSALADRVGRRKVMLIGLVLLGLASLATAFVSTAEQLIAVRAVMGIAAAMTTPGSMALAFRLFDDDQLRVRAMTLISTVGLVGLAVGPTAGGLVLSFAPWQTLLLVNVPIAAVAVLCIRFGIPADRPEELHADPIDVGGDLALIARPLVSSGLAFKAAAGLAVAGLGYLVTLQLQLDWGWTAAQAAVGMLPQVVVLIAGGAVISPLIGRIGLEKAAWVSAAVIVCGLAVYAALGQLGYAWIALALVLVAAGMRVVGVVAGNNVMRGLPADRTTIGAALIDTAGELTTGVGIALSGTIVAGIFTGSIAAHDWTPAQTAQFREATTLAAIVLTAIAGLLVLWGIFRSNRRTTSTTTAPLSGAGGSTPEPAEADR
ncbi:MFS transporter [Promicromonospora sp. NPDC057138]|uniref:MFS transporter n=1 Tax=Promicromonospora sp. NPDC057138 TaxID=3346031 RepID=UPI00362BCEF8